MRIFEAGHTYALQSLDGGDIELLSFVKREGPGYPGNKGSHPGTIIQEVLRVCINRLDYVNNQIPCPENRLARTSLEEAIFHLEHRTAERHGRVLKATAVGISDLPSCKGCGHIECPGCKRIT